MLVSSHARAFKFAWNRQKDVCLGVVTMDERAADSTECMLLEAEALGLIMNSPVVVNVVAVEYHRMGLRLQGGTPTNDRHSEPHEAMGFGTFATLGLHRVLYKTSP